MLQLPNPLQYGLAFPIYKYVLYARPHLLLVPLFYQLLRSHAMQQNMLCHSSPYCCSLRTMIVLEYNEK